MTIDDDPTPYEMRRVALYMAHTMELHGAAGKLLAQADLVQSARADSISTESTRRVAALLALAERCEQEEPSADLNKAIAGIFSRSAAPYTDDLAHAVTLIPPGWLLITLSDGAAADGLNYCKLLSDAGSHTASGLGGRTRALTVCAAALRAHAVLSSRNTT